MAVKQQSRFHCQNNVVSELTQIESPGLLCLG